jgi:hypothetical protein
MSRPCVCQWKTCGWQPGVCLLRCLWACSWQEAELGLRCWPARVCTYVCMRCMVCVCLYAVGKKHSDISVIARTHKHTHAHTHTHTHAVSRTHSVTHIPTSFFFTDYIHAPTVRLYQPCSPSEGTQTIQSNRPWSCPACRTAPPPRHRSRISRDP